MNNTLRFVGTFSKPVFCDPGLFKRVSWAALVLGIATISLSLNIQSASAQHCQYCGCTTKPETKLKLVRTYQKVVSPYYGTNQESRFYHQKGMVSHQRFSTDSFVVESHDRCGNDCQTCKTEKGYQTNQGAVPAPAGTHQSTSFRQPLGVTPQYIPVLKWKKVKHCLDCHALTIVPEIEPAEAVDESNGKSNEEKREPPSPVEDTAWHRNPTANQRFYRR